MFITNQFPPVADGIGDYTFYLAQALMDKRYEAHVLCRPQPSYAAKEGLAIHTIPGEWQDISPKWLLDQLHKIRPDWVVLQYNPYGFHPLGIPGFLPTMLRRTRTSGARVAIVFHEVHIRPKGIKGKVIHLMQRRIARALCRQAHAVVTSIPFYAQLLAPFHADVKIIPIGANFLPGKRGVARPSPSRQTIFPQTPFVLSTFGDRDQTSLLGAVEQLNRNGFPVGLLVCGKNRREEQRDSPYVQYTGWLPAQEIIARLRDSDLFVLPDYCSPQGEGGTCLKSGSLAAAFAAGLPVVGIKGDMTSAPLAHGKNIWLLPKNTPEEIAAAVQRISSDEMLQRTLREGAAKLFEEALSWDVIAAQFRHCLQKDDHAEKLV